MPVAEQELEQLEQKKKKIPTPLLVVLITILTLAVVIGGAAGWHFLRPTYSWSVSDDGVLTISGITVIDFEEKRLDVTGSIPAFDDGAPWDKKNGAITAVEVDKSVTSMSSSALSGLTNLTSIQLPSALDWDSVDTVTVPEKADHAGHWEEEVSGSRKIYTAQYRKIYTVTFEAEGSTVAQVDYLEGDSSVTEPELPEKDGWIANWAPYTLEGDITVSAVYTYAIQTGVTTEKVNIHSAAGTDAKTIGTLSKGMTVALLDETDIDGTPWYRMSIGWVSGDYLTDLVYVGSGLAEHLGIVTSEDYTMSDETAAAVLTGIQLLTVRDFKVSFMLVDLNTGKSISYKADEEFYSASTIKGPYVVSVVDRTPAAASDFYYTIQEILVNSSNDDYFRLRNTYGKTPFVEWCEAAEVDTVLADKYFPSINAEQLCKLWMQNYTYFTTDENGETVAKWFQKPDKSPIRSVLGGKYTTQTKAGWIDDPTEYYRAASDAGIVYAENGPYAVAILSNGRSNLSLLNTLIEALDTAHTEMG